MKNKIFELTQFKYNWLFLPILLFVLYLPQALWGLYLFGDKAAAQLILILMLGLLVYFLTYWILNKIAPIPSIILNINRTTKQASDYFIPVVSAIYFLLIVYTLLTARKIALLEAFRGASADDMAFAREALFKTRVGWERSLPYFNALLSTALMPFAIALSYIEQKKYRHWMLLLFCLSLLPSMEKVLVLKALTPLVMLGLNGYFPVKRVFQLIAIAVLVIAGAFVMTKSGEGNNLDENVKAIDKLSVQKSAVEKLKRERQNVMDGFGEDDTSRALKTLYRQKADLAKLKRKSISEMGGGINPNNNNWAILVDQEKIIDKQLDYYIKVDADAWPNLLKQEKIIDEQMKYYLWVGSYRNKYNALGFGRVAFVVNRVLWIPYITAYDWLGYFDLRLKGRLLHGATSSLLAKISGTEQFPMEKEVFKYQFGTGGPQTAAANATFVVDAFVNFGWFGVASYAFLLAALVYLISIVGNPAMQACSYYFLIQISMGGLPGVLFSNGLLLLTLISLFIKPKQEFEKTTKTSDI
jgi:hypothetical protein